ncbi:MAG: hypothetical protein ACRD6X_14500, partial [Pyrinomonadaceae bacterium]
MELGSEDTLVSTAVTRRKYFSPLRAHEDKSVLAPSHGGSIFRTCGLMRTRVSSLRHTAEVFSPLRAHEDRSV